MRSIRYKLISYMLLLLIIPSLIIGTVGFFIAKSNLDDLGDKTLKNGVEMAIQLIDSMNQQVESGNISLEEAQEQVKVYLIGKMDSEGKREISSPVDLGENGYFFVYSVEGVEVAHPSIEGQSVWDIQDVDGQLFAQKQIELAQSGGGYVTYKWALPNNPDKVAEKITYSEIDPHWGWVISAGTYKMDFNQGANEVLKYLAITLIAAIILGGTISYLLSRNISNPINAITTQVKEVAAGNLSVELLTHKRKDEIGQLINGFNTMVHNLQSLIGKVQHSIGDITSTSQNLSAVAEETTASSEEIGRAIEDISKGAIQQASDADDTNRNTLVLSQQIQVLSEKTLILREGSNEVERSNKTGLESVNTLKSKSTETDHSVQQAREVIESLSTRVREIESIIATINDISNQTNLLALNASIEAARAGEQGKGFAVVASEVRKLAEQTSDATEKVRQTISNIIDESDKAFVEMEKTKELAKEQVQAVSQTEDSFELIANAIKQMATVIKEVDENIQILVSSKDNVVVAVENIAAVSEESAASTEQITSSIDEQLNAITVVSDSATELNDLITGLKNEINKFHL
ncbi:methyl-accepting chemotaxis protein [Bacillus sp. HMF5848]|uniref:methyl-accepting chemotaxis protein n=1 Tax=Bacillus sp. HMF5848 TaxID=2495421 RepID=UPI000F788323|nr:methyl-accepting chemotaxis protein [Bacillus sp. HMF5848]RSK28695.1 methyl-accepting chemotaxis protein [Bacillus sp. HMF5848]